MKTKLSMSVERLPSIDAVPVERRGRLVARICVELADGRARDVTMLAGPDGLFEVESVRSMLHHMSRAIEMPVPAE